MHHCLWFLLLCWLKARHRVHKWLCVNAECEKKCVCVCVWPCMFVSLCVSARRHRESYWCVSKAESRVTVCVRAHVVSSIILSFLRPPHLLLLPELLTLYALILICSEILKQTGWFHLSIHYIYDVVEIVF